MKKGCYSAVQIGNWFLARHKAQMRQDDGIDPMTQMKLHKLLYYAQGVSLAVNGGPLFEDDLLAWAHGPVVRAIYDEYKGTRTIDDELTNEQVNDFDAISEDTTAEGVLEAVYDRYSEYSASQLRNMTHHEAPWKETEHNNVISKEKIKKFFKENIVE